MQWMLLCTVYVARLTTVKVSRRSQQQHKLSAIIQVAADAPTCHTTWQTFSPSRISNLHCQLAHGKVPPNTFVVVTFVKLLDLTWHSNFGYPNRNILIVLFNKQKMQAVKIYVMN